MDTISEKKRIIEELKTTAKTIKEISEKEEYIKRRPIVIEFAGSPKSGKTSCINSLKQFLKRNGFEVEVINERASICPVKDKHSPMFNIWTACSSITGMIGVLGEKNPACDVIILDRGIFDALCWFEWLYSSDRMNSKFRKTVDDFLTINEFVNKIDMVFVFTSSAEKSIEREFAKLLTDEIGSIMNPKVLLDYLEAIEKTITTKSSIFNYVQKIDTTDKNQDGVGKEVTEKTLEIIKGLFIEKIGYIKAEDSLLNTLKENGFGKLASINKNYLNMSFDLRTEIEDNTEYIQPIPIAVFTNPDKNKILAVKKSKNATEEGSPERDKLLLYVGGHIRKEDILSHEDDFLTICRQTLAREVEEEIGISLSFEKIKPFYIYDYNGHEKSRKHLAICFLAIIDTEIQKVNLSSKELLQNKGTTKSGRYLSINEIKENTKQLENWSVQILKNYFDVEGVNSLQLSLFDLDF